MIYIVKPKFFIGNSWLGINKQFLTGSKNKDTFAEIKDKIASSFQKIEIWLSDLDEFDAVSPAKYVAFKAVGTKYYNIEYIKWAFYSFLCLFFKNRKKLEVIRWKEYYNLFLKQNLDNDWLKDEAFKKIAVLLNQNKIKRLLYPGVIDFYDTLKVKKIMITRNIDRIAYRFCQFLSFYKYYYEVDNKGKIVESIIKENPHVRYFGIGGDSEEDASAYDTLLYYYKKGKIEKPLSLQRVYSMKKLFPDFDLYIGKDRRALVDVIKNGSAVPVKSRCLAT